MRKNKSLGTNNIHTKLFKKGGYDLYKYLHEKIKWICKEETLPKDAEAAMYAP